MPYIGDIDWVNFPLDSLCVHGGGVLVQVRMFTSLRVCTLRLAFISMFEFGYVFETLTTDYDCG